MTQSAHPATEVHCQEQELCRHPDLRPAGISYTIFTATPDKFVVQEQCKNLISLEFNYNTNVKPTFYMKFFLQFPRLTRISLEGSLVDEFALDSIGSCCPGLREILLAASTVSDEGLLHLCRWPGWPLSYGAQLSVQGLRECGQAAVPRPARHHLDQDEVQRPGGGAVSPLPPRPGPAWVGGLLPRPPLSPGAGAGLPVPRLLLLPRSHRSSSACGASTSPPENSRRPP